MLTPVLSDNWDQIRSWQLSSYQRAGRHSASKSAPTEKDGDA